MTREPGRPLPADDVRAILRRVQMGEDRGDIAARYGITRSTITKYLRTHKLERGANRRADLTWMGHGNCRQWHPADWDKLDAIVRVGICQGASPDKHVLRGECPVLQRCEQLGLEVPCISTSDDTVFGGMPPEVRYRRQLDARNDQRKAP